MQQLRRRSFFSGNSKLKPRMSETYAIDRSDFRELLREPGDADRLNHCSLMQNLDPKGCTIVGALRARGVVTSLLKLRSGWQIGNDRVTLGPDSSVLREGIEK